jgi:hypothetical protein
LGDILELEVAFVQVQFVAALAVGRKIDIGETVVVNVTNGYASAIVVIQVVENAEGLPGLKIISELDLGLGRGEALEGGLGLGAGAQKDDTREWYEFIESHFRRVLFKKAFVASG